MKNYANIVNNKVKNISVFNDLPSFEPEEGYWLDVTGRDAGIGDDYDAQTDTFTTPIVVPEPITIITNLELWNRFTEAEKETLVGSTTAKVKKFLYELRMIGSVDLTDNRIITAINALETAGMIGAGRAEEILA